MRHAQTGPPPALGPGGPRLAGRADVAGLSPLIERSTADADAGGVSPQPKAGYWYRTLRLDDEGSGPPDPHRFAATAYPATPSDGMYMFIISDDRTIWKKAAIPGGPTSYPVDPAQAGWEKQD